jgi:hypothetical protein
MGLVDKPSFTAGELDPSLWERTNLDKYRNGLATARNWIISKTGSILTRQSRQYMAQTKLSNREVILYSPPGGGVLMEWGHLYVRVYSLTTFLLLGDIAHAYTEADLPNIQFETSGSFVYIFCAGKAITKFNYATGTFVTTSFIFQIPPGPFGATVTPAGTPGGYAVEYGVSFVFKGEESAFVIIGGGVSNLPIATGQSNTLDVNLAPSGVSGDISELRVYRRPYQAGAFGYIGSSTFFHKATGQVWATFNDLGGNADYTHQPPISLLANDSSGVPLDPNTLLSNTGAVYQQRLLITDFVTDLQAIYASQPGFQDNFYRNFPLDAASALKFKCGTSGYARVLRLLDSDGLVAFTSAGIYLNQGDLTPSNIAMVKKGKWIINPSVPPLPVPGGVIFLDAATNGVRNLLWSFQTNSFDADEVSIYSNHFFRNRVVKSWNFQQGAFPLLFCVYSDGTYASFTFDYNQQMQAWTRHDGSLLTKYSCGTTNADQTFFVVAKVDPNTGDTLRYIEFTIPRYVPAAAIAIDPDFDKNPSCAFMDGIVSLSLRVAPLGTKPFVFATTTFTDTDNTYPDWSGPLNVTCGGLGLFTGPAAVVGEVLRFFDEDGSEIDVKILSVTDANNIQVQIDNIDKFPSDWAVNKAVLYSTFSQVTGLTMFEGEYPAAVCDGAVLCSPNNDVDNYDQIQVVGGVFNMPAGKRAAILHLGRPIVADIVTLDIDTVEQSPTLIESLTVNKVYVKVKDSKGLWVGPSLPNGQNETSINGVTGLVPIDTLPVDYTQDDPIIANRAQPAQTIRYEVVLNGDYSKQGKIAIRQVDPLHAEILSFIPDVEVQRRSDR